MKKLSHYMIMLDKWASPTFIDAYSIENAIKRVKQLFPYCDCGCGEVSNVISVKKLR
jgi:hypothetical protein